MGICGCGGRVAEEVVPFMESRVAAERAEIVNTEPVPKPAPAPKAATRPDPDDDFDFALELRMW